MAGLQGRERSLTDRHRATAKTAITRIALRGKYICVLQIHISNTSEILHCSEYTAHPVNERHSQLNLIRIMLTRVNCKVYIEVKIKVQRRSQNPTDQCVLHLWLFCRKMEISDARWEWNVFTRFEVSLTFLCELLARPDGQTDRRTNGTTVHNAAIGRSWAVLSYYVSRYVAQE